MCIRDSLMAVLNDIDAVVKRLTNTTDENEVGRHSLVCQRHFGDGYYIRVLFSLRCVDPVSYTHLRAHETVLDLVTTVVNCNGCSSSFSS